ncbi:MAG: ferredoxin [Lentisphaerae bacterium]|nr:ferredoxin [Lentisphaerota bacterium]
MNGKTDRLENRREFFRRLGRWIGLGALGLLGWPLLGRRRAAPADTVWQLDPEKCIQCGNCATKCVLALSAVKCVHAYDVCGYCNLCGGYHQPYVKRLDTAAENQLCPTSALVRTFIEEPYYQYDVIEERCIGCGVCVKGCGSFGNGSLHLQVRHDRCVNCNDCAIARQCPAQAFRRVPADRPYLMRGERWKAGSRKA